MCSSKTAMSITIKHIQIKSNEDKRVTTDAVKSAAPVAALDASRVKAAPQTAPLWPSNVPIQSPVSP